MHYPDIIAEDPQEILENLVMSLVEHTHEVEIHVSEGSSSSIYSIDVVPEERGKIIGKGGCIIRSLQTLFHAIGCRRGKRINLEIKED